MAEYNDMIITRQGTDLINRQITGEKSLEITKLAVGTGTYTGEENLEEFEELFHPLENYEIYSAKRKDGAVEIKAVVTNRTFNEDATLTEIGVYATDGTTEILYGIATAMCPLQLPAYNGNFEYSVDFSVYFTVNNGVGLTIRDRTDIATEEIAGVVKASEEIQVESDGIMRITEKSKKELLDRAKEFMEMKISDLIGGAPETLDTLKEIADAIAENETIVDALNEAIAKKVNIKDFNTKISNLNTLIKYTTVVTPNPTIGPQIIQKESEIFDLDGNPEPFPIQEVVAGHEAALRQLNTETKKWIELSNYCNFYVEINTSGVFASRIFYNPTIRLIFGIIVTKSAVENQSKLVTLPYLDGVGINGFTGQCGIGNCKGQPPFTARADGNNIFSSHSEGVTLPAGIEKEYFFVFPVL